MSKLLCSACVSCLSLTTALVLPCAAQQRQAPPQRPVAQRQPVQQVPLVQQRPGEPGVQPRVQQQAAPAQPAAPPIREPFRLKPEEQQRIDQLLVHWEKESNKVKLFKCKFTRWDYDRTFGPKANDYLMSERHGEILFRAPDRGTFKEHDMKQYDAATGKYVETTESVEHWVCDGKAIYQFKPKEKTLEVVELPEQMRGKAITEGPLPFIFGAKAETLKQRYWIQETTPREQHNKQIWLEAWPKFREQAAQFQRVEIILGVEDMLPVAMQVYAPNGNDRTAYLFEDRKINDKFGDFITGDFLPPSKPFGWKQVVIPANAPAAEARPENPARQAVRPRANTLR